MIFYLAASYSRKEEVDRYAQKLVIAGHRVHSSWHSEFFKEEHPELVDIKELAESDTLLYFSGGNISGGRHVEFGYGYASGMKICCIGKPENIFHSLPGIEWHDDFEQFLNALSS